jgi:hypothetical protein
MNRHTIPLMALALLGAACLSPATHGLRSSARTACKAPPGYVFVNLVIWNQTDKPERLLLSLDGNAIYSGIIGTSDIYPKIVVHTDLTLRLHRTYTLHLNTRGAQLERFFAAEEGTNIHVDTHGPTLEVTRGPEVCQ